jgi:hypothetical protein
MGSAARTGETPRRAWIPAWLRPPRFDDDEAKTHEAFLLHVVLWALVLVPLPYVLGVLAHKPEMAPRALRQALAGEAANLLLLMLLRAGRVRRRRPCRSARSSPS